MPQPEKIQAFICETRETSLSHLVGNVYLVCVFLSQQSNGISVIYVPDCAGLSVVQIHANLRIHTEFLKLEPS
jgi:hypothetical protein